MEDNHRFYDGASVSWNEGRILITLNEAMGPGLDLSVVDGKLVLTHEYK